MNLYKNLGVVQASVEELSQGAQVRGSSVELRLGWKELPKLNLVLPRYGE